MLVPLPLHWTRLLLRRQNQSQLLAREAGRALGLPVLPDAPLPRRTTPSLGHEGARPAHGQWRTPSPPTRGTALCGRPVVLVDAVMISGATLAVCTQATRATGGLDVRVLVVPRALLDA